MKRTGFSERADGVAFWTMMLLSFVFLTYSYAITQTVDWLLIFVIIIAVFILRFAWTRFAWRKPLSVEVEKVERVAFWGMSLTSLGVLTVEYAVANFFNYYVFYVFVAGLLTKTIVSFSSFTRSLA
jgi:hypothetical protein